LFLPRPETRFSVDSASQSGQAEEAFRVDEQRLERDVLQLAAEEVRALQRFVEDLYISALALELTSLECDFIDRSGALPANFGAKSCANSACSTRGLQFFAKSKRSCPVCRADA